MSNEPGAAGPVRGRSVAVLGMGMTGTHVLAQLATSELPVALSGYDPDRAKLQQPDLSADVRPNTQNRVAQCSAEGGTAAVVVLAGPSRTHPEAAARALARGAAVVSVADDPNVVDGLLALDPRAREAGVPLIVGAGFAPGLACLLARLAADELDEVHEISVSTSGTGGPACARQHHRALKNPGREWLEGQWERRRGGSGRELAWFPGTLGARDSYRAALASPTLLQRSYPEARRISARMTATRRDRLTGRLPMLRPPHDDGGPGGIRVEVRGMRGQSIETVVYGVMAHPSAAAGATAAVVALAILEGRIPIGALGMSELNEPQHLVRQLRQRGIQTDRFDGLSAV